jgi:hypothetical protein
LFPSSINARISPSNHHPPPINLSNKFASPVRSRFIRCYPLRLVRLFVISPKQGSHDTAHPLATRSNSAAH